MANNQNDTSQQDDQVQDEVNLRPTSRASTLSKFEERATQALEKKTKRLNGWVDEIREAPNEILRSALFSAGNKNRKRSQMKNVEIAAYGNCKLIYTGEELRQDDLDVWLEILHEARNQDLDKPIVFNLVKFKKELGFSYGKTYTERLISILTRLKATSVSLYSERLGKGVALSLIRKFEYTDEQGNEITDTNAEWTVELEPEIALLFGGGVYSTRILKEQRMALSGSLAKWLHGFYSSHKDPFPVSYKTLMHNAGSVCSTDGKSRQLIKQAMQELKDCNFLVEWSLDKSGNIKVERNRSIMLPKPKE